MYSFMAMHDVNLYHSLGKFSRRHIDYVFFFLCFPRNRLDILCKLSPICLKYQILFAGKEKNINTRKVVQYVVC